MAGIYLHIPFCKRACHYCNFHFSTSLANKNDFVSALLKEIGFQQQYLQDEIIETVYFGGGTPSLLTNDELYSIFSELNATFKINADAEITLEANPDNISVEKLREWKSLGINRLSIGVQSFFDEDLQWMNRSHNAAQAFDSITNAFAEGFNNITIDFIYGTSVLTDINWKKNIDKAIELNISHLSCYALTVEPKTALAKMIAKKEIKDVDQSDQSRQFLLLMNWLKAAGYGHYEISNFAKPGFRSRHNSSYWQRKKYLGLGPSAHSYNGVSRQWNISNNALYIESLKKNELIFEKEELTSVQKLNEYIMTSLRTMEGCDLNYVANEFGGEAADKLIQFSKIYVEKSLLKINSEIVLTDQGKLFADGIAADLFFENL
ncbi:MAG TPA: radical SAM family heme chaperone HemW [Puia sp.]|nr:radical SAM family heme chaperone HemW [Puia sp.]